MRIHHHNIRGLYARAVKISAAYMHALSQNPRFICTHRHNICRKYVRIVIISAAYIHAPSKYLPHIRMHCHKSAVYIHAQSNYLPQIRIHHHNIRGLYVRTIKISAANTQASSQYPRFICATSKYLPQIRMHHNKIRGLYASSITISAAYTRASSNYLPHIRTHGILLLTRTNLPLRCYVFQRYIRERIKLADLNTFLLLFKHVQRR